jgi:hypothetical protein
VEEREKYNREEAGRKELITSLGPPSLTTTTTRGTRLNTCTWCPLRTFDALKEYRRAKIESFRVEVVVLGVFPDLIVFATVGWIG